MEVKYRAGLKYGHPLYAVTKGKIKSIIKTAKYYLYTHHYPVTTSVRFDVISILGKELSHIENAFTL